MKMICTLFMFGVPDFDGDRISSDAKITPPKVENIFDSFNEHSLKILGFVRNNDEYRCVVEVNDDKLKSDIKRYGLGINPTYNVDNNGGGVQRAVEIVDLHISGTYFSLEELSPELEFEFDFETLLLRKIVHLPEQRTEYVYHNEAVIGVVERELMKSTEGDDLCRICIMERYRNSKILVNENGRLYVD